MQGPTVIPTVAIPCQVTEGVAYINGVTIANDSIQQTLQGLHGVSGVLVFAVGDHAAAYDKHAEVDYTFYLTDYTLDLHTTHNARVMKLAEIADKYFDARVKVPPNLKLIPEDEANV